MIIKEEVSENKELETVKAQIKFEQIKEGEELCDEEMGEVAGGAKPPTGSAVYFSLFVTFTPGTSAEAVYQKLKKLMISNQVPENIINQMSLEDIRRHIYGFSDSNLWSLTLIVEYRYNRFDYSLDIEK